MCETDLMLQLASSINLQSRSTANCEPSWDGTAARRSNSNSLSNELLEHMLDCDACLGESLDEEMVGCSAYRKLQEKIVSCGGPTKPLIFAY